MWRNNSLSIVLVSLFVASMIGQAWTGWLEHNDDALQHDQAAIAFTDYLSTGAFWEATMENWESEFLQMGAFVLLTCFLRQKGSTESKGIGTVEEVDIDPRHFAGDREVPWPVRRGGWVLRLYENSLGLTFALLFAISIGGHAIAGASDYNEDRLLHGEATVTVAAYVASPRFWFESFQNWQSEFLSLAAMVVGTIYLRQRGSAESKAVHAPHDATGR